MEERKGEGVFFLSLRKLKSVEKRLKKWEKVVSLRSVTFFYDVSYLCALD